MEKIGCVVPLKSGFKLCVEVKLSAPTSRIPHLKSYDKMLTVDDFFDDWSFQMTGKSAEERKLREQGYIRIDRFCEAMDTWALSCQKELPSDREHHLRWRKEFGEHWQFIRAAIAKSCLLDRLIYGGETLRKEMCPTHQGHWSGCNISGENPCECQHDTCITGWLRNAGDPNSQASFRVTLLRP